MPIRLGVLGQRHPALQLALDGVREGRAGGDEDRRRHRVVLGLADEVGGDVDGVGGVVGEHGDLRRPGLGVDAHDALQQSLRSGHVDVAGAGDEVDRVAASLPTGPAP